MSKAQARSTKEISSRPRTGTTANTRAEGTGGDFLRPAHRLPVESGSTGIREREHNPPQISRMAKGWFFEKIWALALTEYDELEGIGWEWQSIDGSMVKAPLAEEKMGTKRSVLTDENGLPLARYPVWRKHT